MRLFCGSFLGLENMESYGSLAADLAADVPDSLRPSRMQHLTLVLPGEVPESDVEVIRETLACVQSIPAFSFSLSFPRILYSRRSPRLVLPGPSGGVGGAGGV